MKVTNKYGVPGPFVTLATREYYSKGDAQYSTTELISPPRVRRLREQYDHLIEIDVTELLWSMLGSALHVVLERGETDGYTKEERIFATVDGVRISGQVDLQEDAGGGVNVIDHKFTKAWAVMNAKSEWEQQLNVYKWFVETVNGKAVKSLKICAMIRDFNRHDKRENYPPSEIHMVEVPMWSNEKAEQFIRSRLEAHRDSKVAHDFGDELPECSPQDRWMSETMYAVKREGRKTAIRVFKSMEEATQLAEKEKGYVETRHGEPKRCTGNYCGVNQWCSQFADWTANQPSGASTPEAERQ